ncbi:hypothetical protein Tco_1512799, partial [Tanacetum coccineum]
TLTHDLEQESTSESELEELPEDGRKITEIDQDPGISLVQLNAEIQWRHEHEPAFDFDDANVPVTTTGAEFSTASPKVKTSGNSIEDIVVETLVYIRRSAAKAKDKGKMKESESAMTKIKRQQEQERLGFEVAVRLQTELDKEERQRISRAECLI